MQIRPGMFNTVPLSDDEQLQGAMYSTVQIASLQNVLASVGEEIVQTTLNASDPDAFIKVARAQGQASILRFLIERSNNLTSSPSGE